MRQILKAPLALTFFLATASAQTPARTQLPLRTSLRTAPIQMLGHYRQLLLSNPFAAINDTYRIGDEWGKKPVTAEILAKATPAFRRAALATASTGSATAFYLGEFNGQLVVASNHHVFPQAGSCLGRTINFAALGVKGRCSTFYGSWPEIDLSLFAIKVAGPAEAGKLNSVGRNFDFANPLAMEMPLVTIGFGVGNNPNHLMMANQDADCKVFSREGESRFMADPDTINPGEYKAWSFANGCDVSHGDSGSAMVDRNTGRVVGIIWTGKIPKSPQAQSSAHLQELLRNPTEEIWTELSYSVPAFKIAPVLARLSASPQTPSATREILRALLAKPN